VKSTNCSWSGAGGPKSRFTRSGDLGWGDGSTTVVRGFFRPPRRNLAQPELARFVFPGQAGDAVESPGMWDGRDLASLVVPSARGADRDG